MYWFTLHIHACMHSMSKLKLLHFTTFIVNNRGIFRKESRDKLNKMLRQTLSKHNYVIADI